MVTGAGSEEAVDKVRFPASLEDTPENVVLAGLVGLLGLTYVVNIQ